MSVLVLVNADDLGRTHEINDGIEEAHRRGIVSSTSIVANSPAFDHGVEIARRNPTLDVGIHLSANEYPPLISDSFLGRLSSKGLRDAFTLIAIATPAQIALIAEDFEAQVQRALERGLTLSHVDGHNHVHVHPRLIGVVSRLANKYNLPMTRLPHEPLLSGARRIEKVMLNPVCVMAKSFFKFRGLRFAESFHGFSEGGRMTRDRLMGVLSKLRPGVNEIMCHVGTVDDDPPFSIGYRWAMELDALTSLTPSELLSKFGARLVRRHEVFR